MGAVFCSAVLKATNSKEAKAAARVYQEEQCYEYGHDAYSGHLGVVDGVDHINRVFRDVEEAKKYAMDRHDKWDPPMLMKFGPDTWLLAGWMPE